MCLPFTRFQNRFQSSARRYSKSMSATRLRFFCPPRLFFRVPRNFKVYEDPVVNGLICNFQDLNEKVSLIADSRKMTIETHVESSCDCHYITGYPSESETQLLMERFDAFYHSIDGKETSEVRVSLEDFLSDVEPTVEQLWARFRNISEHHNLATALCL